MKELKLFVETGENLGDDIFISATSAEALGVSDGSLVKVAIPEENFETTLNVRINESLFDFVVQVDENLPEILGFKSMELTISPVSEGGPAKPRSTAAPGPAPSMHAVPTPPQVPGMPPGMPGTPPALPAMPSMPGAPPAVPKVPAMPSAPPAVPPMPSMPGAPPAVPPMPSMPGAPPAVPAMPSMPGAPPAVPAMPSMPGAPPAVPAMPSMPGAPPAVPATPSPPSIPAAAPSMPKPAAQPPAPKPAVQEFEIITETKWTLLPNQIDAYAMEIVDAGGNAVYGADAEGFPLDSAGAPFHSAQYTQEVVEKRVPKGGTAAVEEGPEKEKVQVLVPNQIDMYGVEIVDSNNNPLYGMDESGWYVLDSTGQPFAETQWMEIEVEKKIEKGPFPPSMRDDFGQQVVDENGFAIYGSDEYNQPLDPNGKGVWWDGSSRPKYPDMVDIGQLASQKNGLILTPRIDNTLSDKIALSASNVEALGLYEGMLAQFEDHKTRGTGAGRIKVGGVDDKHVGMSQDAYDAANIVEKDDAVVYSAEPPIEKREVMEVNVKLVDDFAGKCAIGPRLSISLDLGGRSQNEVMAFEDPLTGAFGAAKVTIDPELPEDVIKIDSEIYEASGIGSDVVEIKINRRPIIPIQEATIGINPLEGDQVHEVLAKARRFVGQLKSWLSQYIVFKDLKLRWKQAGAAIKILDSKPDLSGDVLAELKPTSNILLKPEGLVTFNAILVIDISRSMMARDLEVKQIGPAIEGIKAAMGSKEIQDFLKQFKEGTSVMRRIGAAFAAILFLAEKVGRGFGEKVSIIRFADTAEALDFGKTPFMEGSSGEKDVLESAAKNIVENIGNAYGQATNMGGAMLLAQELIYQMQDQEGGEEQAKPVMVILLTDGEPTDGNNFEVAVQEIAKNQNVVMYIIGLGQADVKRMSAAASSCGGEYFEPEDAGKLLIWYSKRARDLQVRLKSQKKKEEGQEELY